MKRAKRVKWQAPTVLQSTHVVAEATPIPMTVKESPSATFFCMALPVVMLTLSLRSIASITTGILCSYARKMMIFLVFLNFTI